MRIFILELKNRKYDDRIGGDRPTRYALMTPDDVSSDKVRMELEWLTRNGALWDTKEHLREMCKRNANWQIHELGGTIEYKI